MKLRDIEGILIILIRDYEPEDFKGYEGLGGVSVTRYDKIYPTVFKVIGSQVKAIKDSRFRDNISEVEEGIRYLYFKAPLEEIPLYLNSMYSEVAKERLKEQ